MNIPITLKNFAWTTSQPDAANNTPCLAYHSDMHQAWRICCMKNCSYFVHEDKIWTCPMAYIAYRLRMEHLIDEEEWKDVLSIPYMTAKASDEELKEYLNTKMMTGCRNCRAQHTQITPANKAFPQGLTNNYQHYPLELAEVG
jgi:hypothetical protein